MAALFYFRTRFKVPWPSGQAEVCKTFHSSSNLLGTSKFKMSRRLPLRDGDKSARISQKIPSLLLRGILICSMKYSQLLGVIAVVALAGVCYLPWSFISGKNIIVTGMNASGTDFGKPGLMHLVLGTVLFIFFLIPKIWAKRFNVFIAAINLAWSIRNYILLTTCYMGECPHKKPGLFLLLAICSFIQVMTFFPKIKLPEN